MKIVDREEVVFYFISVNESFVSIIVITLSQFFIEATNF